MRRRGTLDKPDSQFIVLAVDLNDQCVANAAAWNLDAERLTELTALVTAAYDAYTANVNDRTSNKETSETKKAAFQALKQFLGLYIDSLVGNLAIPDSELKAMGLRSRTRQYHGKLPRPTEAPVVMITGRHGQITVGVSKGSDGHPTQSVNPDRHHGFMLRWRFENETEMHFVTTTRLRHTLAFEAADELRRIVLSAAWINPTLEEGPWSEPVTTHVI
jgi:hypothetical protein